MPHLRLEAKIKAGDPRLLQYSITPSATDSAIVVPLPGIEPSCKSLNPCLPDTPKT